MAHTNRPTTTPPVHDAARKDEAGFPAQVQERLFRARQVFLSGPVTERLARRIVSELLALEGDDPHEPITLLVNSPGGSVSDGFAIYDTIRFIEPPVTILSMGLCASIATIILVAVPKERRLATPNTRMLIHQPHIPMDVYGPASDLEITAREIMRTRDRINELLAEATGQPLERVERDTQRDYWMGANEAIEYGLISRVVVNRREIARPQ